MRVAILGCGSQGQAAAKRLAPSEAISGLIVADQHEASALKVAAKLGGKAVAQQVDVTDRKGLESILGQVDIVVNTVGPFFKYLFPVLDAAIACKINYVDICDDYDVCEELFLKPDYDMKAKKAGITALSCMGSAPGITNVIAKLGCQQMERVKAVHVYMAWGYWRLITPAVWRHIFHCLGGEVIQYLGGRYQKIPTLGGRENIKFPEPIGWLETYYFGHSEAVTLPRFIPGLEEATVKSACYQPEANTLLGNLVKYGFANRERVAGLAEPPVDYISAYIPSQEGAAYFNVEKSGLEWRDHWGVDGVMQIEVIGENQGIASRRLYELRDANGNFSTARSLATAVEAMARGEISTKGVLAPEACIDPLPFLRKVMEREPGVSIYERTEQLVPL